MSWRAPSESESLYSDAGCCGVEVFGVSGVGIGWLGVLCVSCVMDGLGTSDAAGGVGGRSGCVTGDGEGRGRAASGCVVDSGLVDAGVGRAV